MMRRTNRLRPTVRRKKTLEKGECLQGSTLTRMRSEAAPLREEKREVSNHPFV